MMLLGGGLLHDARLFGAIVVGVLVLLMVYTEVCLWVLETKRAAAAAAAASSSSC